MPQQERSVVVEPLQVASFAWSPDPAASGPRHRARDGLYELCAYEDGRWYVRNNGARSVYDQDVGVGMARSFEHAQQTAVAVYNLVRA